jgi:hypothetical protein
MPYLAKFLSFIITVWLITVSNVLFAQLPDDKKNAQEWIVEIAKNMDEEAKLLYNAASVYNTANLSIVAYIVRDTNGVANCSEGDIITCVNTLNRYFRTINVAFNLQPVQYVNDYNYSYIHNEGDTHELVKKHSTAATINLYLVDSIELDSVPFYGFTYFPFDTTQNYIFLDNDFIQGNYLTTLMGHFFGLLSTHETLGGVELVNETNCAASGDFLCDTWADPDLFEKVDESCVYTGASVDLNGEDYVPSVANLMSASNDKCKCIFTPHQYRRMLFYLKNYRYYLR